MPRSTWTAPWAEPSGASWSRGGCHRIVTAAAGATTTPAAARSNPASTPTDRLTQRQPPTGEEDTEVADLFRKAQADSRKGAELGKQLLRARLAGG
ncbi:hypothetical protein ACGFT2_08625 [Streptomyces sp. NPDC048514]|uniref:hypothetical protein n=1 Tax=Streptomyces sp. NPDC048514 TaxID=3365564 RepID=UPI003710FDF0